MRAVIGLFFTLTCTRSFPLSILKGKRVVIVGPASSAFDTEQGSFIDSFDLVVRLNKAPLQLKEGKFSKNIGTRTSVLFHSFFENDFSGGGALDYVLFRSLGINYVIQPIPTWAGWRVIFNFYKKYLKAERVYTLPRDAYNDLQSRMGMYKPTTGLCALKCLMEAELSELHITGFTFFRTGYGAGYRDEMREVEQTKAYISKMKIHNPDLEFLEFKRMLKSVRNKRVVLDKALNQIVAHEG